ncbi:MAG: DUF1844 domain-containing protein [Candidatus Rokubacteria bacterium]|nr:DUF1844 domain-containing protein [Candidatus Rokubacteria bacterium]
MADEDEGFKITDRRGQRREWTQTPAAPPAAPESARPTASSGAAGPGPPAGRARAGEGDLGGLFVMFASSALIGLGAAPDPMSGEQRVDLEQAREGIETLLLLRAKTEGNRTEDESRLLEEILYDLQMRYVQATRRPGRPG